MQEPESIVDVYKRVRLEWCRYIASMRYRELTDDDKGNVAKGRLVIRDIDRYLAHHPDA